MGRTQLVRSAIETSEEEKRQARRRFGWLWSWRVQRPAGGDGDDDEDEDGEEQSSGDSGEEGGEPDSNSDSESSEGEEKNDWWVVKTRELLDPRDEDGRTPLMRACAGASYPPWQHQQASVPSSEASASLVLVELLVESGADPFNRCGRKPTCHLALPKPVALP